MPDPMIQTSASEVKAPSLPSVGDGETPGERNQKDCVELSTGRVESGRLVIRSRTTCSARAFNGAGRNDKTRVIKGKVDASILTTGNTAESDFVQLQAVDG